MPITLSVTCDSEAELAHLLENLRFATELTALKTAERKGKKDQPATKQVSAGTATVTKKPAKKSASADKSSRPGRKPGKLIPIIESAIAETVKRGEPFRSRDVVQLVMKKAPELNESSVTTGVSKMLSESNLKSDLIKDTIGRPYRLYKP